MLSVSYTVHGSENGSNHFGDQVYTWRFIPYYPETSLSGRDKRNACECSPKGMHTGMLIEAVVIIVTN